MSDLVEAVAAARRREVVDKVVDAVHSIYASLERAIAERRPRCDASGRCCYFETYGHRLYITTAELATFLEDLPSLPEKPGSHGTGLTILGSTDSCPLLENNLCSVHTIRPFGCRIFFCDPTAEQWMQDAYETHLAMLKAVHAKFDIPYHYVEWRQALLAVGVKGR